MGYMFLFGSLFDPPFAGIIAKIIILLIKLKTFHLKVFYFFFQTYNLQ